MLKSMDYLITIVGILFYLYTRKEGINEKVN